MSDFSNATDNGTACPQFCRLFASTMLARAGTVIGYRPNSEVQRTSDCRSKGRFPHTLDRSPEVFDNLHRRRSRRVSKPHRWSILGSYSKGQLSCAAIPVIYICSVYHIFSNDRPFVKFFNPHCYSVKRTHKKANKRAKLFRLKDNESHSRYAPGPPFSVTEAQSPVMMSGMSPKRRCVWRSSRYLWPDK